jgi:hypothetical protein
MKKANWLLKNQKKRKYQKKAKAKLEAEKAASKEAALLLKLKKQTLLKLLLKFLTNNYKKQLHQMCGCFFMFLFLFSRIFA